MVQLAIMIIMKILACNMEMVCTIGEIPEPPTSILLQGIWF